MNWLMPAWERDQFMCLYTRKGDDILFYDFTMWLAYYGGWGVPEPELALQPVKRQAL